MTLTVTRRVSRSDLYELIPGTSAAGTLNTAGRYLGYFELKPDGSLTFNTGKPPLTNPAITAIVRDGGVTTVSFTTVAGATYQLRATGADGLATSPSSWAAGATVVGTGSVLTLARTPALKRSASSPSRRAPERRLSPDRTARNATQHNTAANRNFNPLNSSALQSSAFSLPLSEVKVERTAEGGPVSPIE